MKITVSYLENNIEINNENINVLEIENKKIFFLKIFTQGNPLRGVGGCNFLQLFTSYRTVLELLKSSPIIYFFANID